MEKERIPGNVASYKRNLFSPSRIITRGIQLVSLVSMVALLGTNLHLHGHVEISFAGMSSQFDLPNTSLIKATFSSKGINNTQLKLPQDGFGSVKLRSLDVQALPAAAAAGTTRKNITAPARTNLLQFRPGQLLFHDERALARDRHLFLLNDPKIKPIVLDLIQQANSAMKSGPWSVMDKPDDSVAPSGIKADFFNVASYDSPYFDNESRMTGRGSERYDRSRFKDMRYNTTILALAYAVTNKAPYALMAVRNIRVWFVTRETRMNANMDHAHCVKAGLKRNKRKTILPPPAKSIDMMGDIYFLLDAVRLVSTYFHPIATKRLRRWLRTYLKWLDRSVMWTKEERALQYYGPFLDIQAVAIAAHLDDLPRMERYIERAIARMTIHIDHDTGEMPPDVMKADDCETRLLHSLQGWSIMSRLTMTVNRNLWKYHPSMQNDTESLLCRASRYVIPFYGRKRQCSRRMQRVPAQSWWPLFYESQMYCPSLQRMTISVPTWLSKGIGTSVALPPASVYDMPSLYDPKYGIAPFWHVGKLFYKE